MIGTEFNPPPVQFTVNPSEEQEHSLTLGQVRNIDVAVVNDGNNKLKLRTKEKRTNMEVILAVILLFLFVSRYEASNDDDEFQETFNTPAGLDDDCDEDDGRKRRL